MRWNRGGYEDDADDFPASDVVSLVNSVYMVCMPSVFTSLHGSAGIWIDYSELRDIEILHSTADNSLRNASVIQSISG